MTVVIEALWVFVYSVALGAVIYVGFLCWGWWSKRRALTKAWRQYKSQQTWLIQTIATIPPIPTIAPIVPSFHAGGLVHNQLMAGLSVGNTISQVFKSLKDESEPLEETWSNEKVEAWRVIPVTVEKGDDGMWLGFPHSDGPSEDVVTPVRHHVGIELKAKCKDYSTSPVSYPQLLCAESPGENCKSYAGSGCGYYAFKTREQAVEYQIDGCFGKSAAVAKVLLSGKVIEHENGYRAEILEVVSVELVSYSSLTAISFQELASTKQAFIRAGQTFQRFTGGHIASGGV